MTEQLSLSLEDILTVVKCISSFHAHESLALLGNNITSHFVDEKTEA